jgi:outer membrane immunogenic protein
LTPDPRSCWHSGLDVKTKLFLATLATVFLASAASAADLPVKAPSASATATPWSGFYLGGGIGFQASDARETLDLLSIGGSPLQTPAQVEEGEATREPLNGLAFRGTVYAGYNWQVTRQWVLGLESDLGLTNHTTTYAGLAFPDQSLIFFSAADGIRARTTWDASVRGRVGFLVAPTTLFYATGGAAWQHYEIATNCFVFCMDLGFGLPGAPFSTTPEVTSNSVTKLGWTVGGGVETALGGHWFARADYRFADFGDTTFTIKRNTTFLPFNPIVNVFDVSFRTHTASLGLAYKFGDEVSPSAASAGWFDNVLPVKALATKAPAAPASWSGLYAGLGIGPRASRTEATTTGPFDNISLLFPAGANSQPLNGTAFRGSPYLGWNWQIAPKWVVGLEGDVGFANQTTSLPGLGFSPGTLPFTGSKDSSFAVRTTWDANLGGRVGFLVTPATLLYATAGAAWQHFEAISTCSNNGGSPGCSTLLPLVVTNSATKAGWTAGLGAETLLSGNWFARAAYRYADLGTSSFAITRNPGPVSTDFDVALRTHTVTFGVSYKFGGLGGLPVAN